MAIEKFNLKNDYRIKQGADYGIEITVVYEDGELYDLSGATCEAQVRQTKDSTSAIDFTASVDTATSVITLTMAAAVTETFTYWTGYWDCELTISGVVTRIVEGSVVISQQVTD